MKSALTFWFLAAGALSAGQATVTPLISKDLTGAPGKEGAMITVEYAPGASDAMHRHNAHTFVYVLEGSVVMQVKGGNPVTLGPGQTFYESPEDVHTVSRNASNTKPAKFLVCERKGRSGSGAGEVIRSKDGRICAGSLSKTAALPRAGSGRYLLAQ